MRAVTLLSSTGIRALFDLKEQLAANDNELALIAPADSAAARVLDIVGMPYRTLAA
ncbi:hypothetical protein ACFVLF_23930 [Bacillus subtilis]